MKITVIDNSKKQKIKVNIIPSEWERYLEQ